jgi:NADPH-dependent curcumin reductase CurA
VLGTGRECQLAARPRGRPRDSDFRIAEVPIPKPAQGELLVRNTWMSLDPSTRIRMDESDSTYMPSFELDGPLDGNVLEQLRAAAPDGVDVYFDNVGGDHLQAALEVLRPRGRVALCGMVSTYNASEPVPGPSNLFNAIAKGLTLRGFLARMYADQMEEFRREMRGWIAEGKIFYPEMVFDGLDQAPRALLALLDGENIGKVLVKLV